MNKITNKNLWKIFVFFSVGIITLVAQLSNFTFEEIQAKGGQTLIFTFAILFIVMSILAFIINRHLLESELPDPETNPTRRKIRDGIHKVSDIFDTFLSFFNFLSIFK